MDRAILIVIAGAVVIVLVRFLWKKKMLASIPGMSDEALKALFDHPKNVHLFQRATEELKGRDVDISFVFPQYPDALRQLAYAVHPSFVTTMAQNNQRPHIRL